MLFHGWKIEMVDQTSPYKLPVVCHYLDENTESICLNFTNDTKLDGTENILGKSQNPKILKIWS